jgi:hypothetical protein
MRQEQALRGRIGSFRAADRLPREGVQVTFARLQLSPVELVVATAPDGSSQIHIFERRRHGSEFAEQSGLLFGRQRRGLGENVAQSSERPLSSALVLKRSMTRRRGCELDRPGSDDAWWVRSRNRNLLIVL